MQRREATHRQAYDMRLSLPKMVEDGADVVGGARLRVSGDFLRHVGGRIAPCIEGDAAVTLAEVAHLRLPAAVVARELVHEDHGASGAGLLVVQPHAVIGGGQGHRDLLSDSGNT
jgi:hypothetical protein